MFAFPPFALLHQVLLRVLHSQNLVKYLVTSLWPQKEWYSDLLALLVENLCSFPGCGTCAFSCTRKFHKGPESLTTHLDVIKQLVHKINSLEEIAVCDSTDVRCSAAYLYKGKWSKFFHCCPGRNISTYKAMIQAIVQFFFHLCEELKLMVSLIKGYKSAFHQVFSLTGKDLAGNRVISKIFTKFENTCLPKEVKPRDWNFALVLRSLLHLPHKPLKLSPDRHLT